MLLVQLFPREGQEMVCEAHDRAFAFFGGICQRGIYDNMKTAVSTVFVGRERAYNLRFQEMCSHHLVEPVACTPGAGWENGQVENQVGYARSRLFVPRPRGRSYAELNAWLLDACIRDVNEAAAKELKARTLTSLYNARPQWLMDAHATLDATVAANYEWDAGISKQVALAELLERDLAH